MRNDVPFDAINGNCTDPLGIPERIAETGCGVLTRNGCAASENDANAAMRMRELRGMNHDRPLVIGVPWIDTSRP
jgi:hypothetical protein